MATFVIVHGAWGGGWEWTPVARVLRERGHEVFTPTLTGMGERTHLGRGEAVDLATHIRDVVAVLEFEDLHDVVLCGASYGGMPVTGAGDHAADRVGMVVYVDALVPSDGQAAVDLLPASFAEMVKAGTEEHPAEWRVPFPPALLSAFLPEGSMSQERRAGIVARLCDQPVATFTEQIRLTGTIDRLPRAFIRCLEGTSVVDLVSDPIEPMAVRARAAEWLYRELSAPHDPHLFDPDGIAAVLDELASLRSK